MLDVSRREIKYEIDSCQELKLKRLLSAVLEGDKHNGKDGYRVRSLYFDTPDALDYYEKIDGLENRKKIRLRIYDFGDSPAKLELKQKQGIQQRKQTLTLNREQAEQIIAGDYSCLDDCGDFGRYMRLIMQTGAYRPACLVEYDRTAFFCRTNDTRITLDSGLRSNEGSFELYDASVQLYPVTLPGKVTLEVKYNRFLLSYIKDVVSTVDMLGVSGSKYCRCRRFGLGGEGNI